MPSSPVAERVPLAALALSLALVAGCGSGPAPRLHVLEPLAGDGVERGAQALAPLGPLGVATVTLPGYARDARIASRDAGIVVTLDDENRWAESPDEAITRVLAERLRRHAGGNVLIAPWPRGFEPAARVEIAFERLLREPSGGVEASGQIRLLAGDGRAVLEVRPFRLARGAGSTEPEAFFAALAALLDDIAHVTVAALRGGEAGS